ncbi:MAG: transposase [Candidatus Competibacteraceae bacterium]|nr:transposase [Candidatus Competibacteraceae bacterium]
MPRRRAYGYCAAKKQPYYGLHGHLMITVDGVITACTVTTAAGDEREALWEFTEGVHGLVIGDKGYMSAFVKAERATVGIDRQTPLRANRTETRTPNVVRRLTRTRRHRGNRDGPTDGAVSF